MTKICKTCSQEKEAELFAKNKNNTDGRLNICKVCVNVKQKELWLQNKDKNAIDRRKRRQDNIDSYRKREAAYRKKYREINREEVNAKYRDYMRKYRKSKPSFRVQKYISYVIKYSLDTKSSTHTIFSRLGYTVEQLMTHLESKFKEGMSWDNYGEWHIDHIVPQSWLPFNTMEEENFIKCWCLDNLQPLWAKENISKGNRFAG